MLEVDADLLAAAVPGVAIEHLLTGGEDHGLVGTVPPDAALPPGVLVIGRALAPGDDHAAPGVRVLGDGVPPDLRERLTGETGHTRASGWDHFGSAD
jgi:thiamine-monophosphate kinase